MAKKKAAERKVVPKKVIARAKLASDFFSRDASAEQNRLGVKKWNRLTASERARVNFAGVDLRGCDLTSINLSGVKSARGALFARANLSVARLAGNFDQASFATANLAGARIADADFLAADFTGADLSGAELSASQFVQAKLVGVNFSGATFSIVGLQGADLTGANLAGAIFARSAGVFNKETKWPAGFVPPGEFTWVGRGTDPRFTGKGKRAAATDINGLMARLHSVIDAKRMQRTLDMLKKEKHQLFSEVEPNLIRGIVRSQKEEDLVYSCVLTEDGTYSCATPDVVKCMGLSNEPCKHILVLVIGLARAGLLDPALADRWMVAAKTKGPRWNKTTQNHISDSLLKYKGAVAGELDWRPTETIPEDFYAM